MRRISRVQDVAASVYRPGRGRIGRYRVLKQDRSDFPYINLRYEVKLYRSVVRHFDRMLSFRRLAGLERNAFFIGGRSPV